jgi:hypothetical protein
MEGKRMHQLLSYVKYCQFIILTFIASLLWAMGLWTVRVILDNGVLPLLPHSVGPAKAEMSKTRKGSTVKRS